MGTRFAWSLHHPRRPTDEEDRSARAQGLAGHGGATVASNVLLITRWRGRLPRFALLWLFGLVPATSGLVLALLLQSGRFPNSVWYLQADLGTLLLLLGLLLSAVAFCVVALWQHSRTLQEHTAADLREQAAAVHRRFVAGLKHEVNNPLTAMQAGLAKVAAASAEAEREEALTSVHGQVERLGRLVADLSKLTELEGLAVEQEPVDVAELLQEAVDQTRHQRSDETERVALSLPRAWPLPTVNGDRDLLFLAVYNLLDNALKFTEDGQLVDVRAFEDRAGVAIEVADTGPGVPPDELPHLFEELYRGTGARGVPGSGLGLALVKRVTERHGGSVTARSRLGQGTIFTLRLPLG